MKRIAIAIGVVAVVTAGCQHSQMEARAEATKRWQASRAQLLCTVAMEQYRVGQLPTARAKITEVLTLDPDNLSARVLLAKVCIGEAKYAAAVDELERVRARLPESAEVAYLTGVAKERDGKLEDALVDYRRAQALNTASLDGAKAAAEVLVALGRVDEATLYIESYIAQAGDDAAMYELAGRVAMMRKDYAKAVEHYQQAADLDTKNLTYRESLARAQFLSSQPSAAAETLRDLMACPKYVARGWIYAMLGECYLAKGRAADARDAFTAATNIEPASAGTWLGLAKAALALNDPARAILSAREALRLDDASVEAQLVLGYALLRDSQLPASLEVLSRAAGAEPENITAQCLLGKALAQSGDKAAAAKCYRQALQAQPGNPLAKELLASLER